MKLSRLSLSRIDRAANKISHQRFKLAIDHNGGETPDKHDLRDWKTAQRVHSREAPASARILWRLLGTQPRGPIFRAPIQEPHTSYCACNSCDPFGILGSA